MDGISGYVYADGAEAKINADNIYAKYVNSPSGSGFPRGAHCSLTLVSIYMCFVSAHPSGPFAARNVVSSNPICHSRGRSGTKAKHLTNVLWNTRDTTYPACRIGDRGVSSVEDV